MRGNKHVPSKQAFQMRIERSGIRYHKTIAIAMHGETAGNKVVTFGGVRNGPPFAHGEFPILLAMILLSITDIFRMRGKKFALDFGKGRFQYSAHKKPTIVEVCSF